MLPSNGKYCNQELDYHVTNDEIKQLLHHVKQHYSQKMYLLASLVWSRGFRISEALAVNVKDFPLARYGNFSRLNFREAKTNKKRNNEIIVDPVAELIRDYILSNPLILTHYEGYLFFRRNGKRWHNMPVMTPETVGAFMAKWRRSLSKKNPAFNEKYTHHNYTCGNSRHTLNDKKHHELGRLTWCLKCKRPLQKKQVIRYRISWHSLRRNMEDNGLDYSNDNVYFVKEMMHYKDVRIVDHYASKRRLRAKVPQFFEECITPAFNEFRSYDDAQKPLSAYT